MMYSAYQLKKQGDNIQPWRTPFPIWNESFGPCPVLTVDSRPTYRVLWRQVRWAGVPITWRIFHSLLWSCTVKAFGVVHKAEVDVFLAFSCFFHDPADVGNLIFDSSGFSESNWNIWKLTVHVQLKPGLENLEHYFASVWDECNCAVVLAFFAIAFLWDWNQNWPFPVLWPLLSFPNLQACWVQHFHSLGLQDLQSFHWNPSPSLALFVVMFPKALLTLHPKMSGSRWVIIPCALGEWSHHLRLGRCYLHIWDYRYFSRQSGFQLVFHPAQHLAWCTVLLS